MDNKHLIVADSSPLIAMALLDLLACLSDLAEDVFVPDTVYHECTSNLSLPGAKAIKKAAGDGLLTRCEDLDTDDSPLLDSISRLVDAGEAQAIALAQNMSGLLLIDDKAGRRCARHNEIPVIGSIGVLLKMQKVGMIDDIEPMIEQLQNHGYRYSASLIAKALLASGELHDGALAEIANLAERDIREERTLSLEEALQRLQDES